MDSCLLQLKKFTSFKTSDAKRFLPYIITLSTKLYFLGYSQNHLWKIVRCFYYSQVHSIIQIDPNGSCLFAAGSSTHTVGSQNFQTFSTRQIAFWWRSGRCRQCYSDFQLQCAGDIEADHTDSGIVMDCADRNRTTWRLMRRANNNNNSIIQMKLGFP